MGRTPFMIVPCALKAKTATNATELSGGINQAYIAALEVRIEALELTPVTIGDSRDGGMVFWGDPENPSKGKVCVLSNDPKTLNWEEALSYCDGYTNSDTGKGGYTCWYLPGKDELQLTYANLQRFGCSTNTSGSTDSGLYTTRRGSFDEEFYWSSKENDNGNAGVQIFYYCNLTNDFKLHKVYVSAVRAF